MNFFETRMGRKFFEHDIPKLIKAVERVADGLEKVNNEPNERERDAECETFHRNKLFSKMLDFARTSECLDAEVVKKQLHSLWVAYCIHANYDVDTAPYDNDLMEIWDVVSKNPTNSFSDYDSFDMYMCEDLV